MQGRWSVGSLGLVAGVAKYRASRADRPFTSGSPMEVDREHSAMRLGLRSIAPCRF